MTARDIAQTSAIKWIIGKGQPQIDGDGKNIPGSVYFSGNLPGRMAREIKDAFKAAGATYRDCGKTVIYSVSSGDTESDFGMSATFGAHNSTQNRIVFTLTPYTW